MDIDYLYNICVDGATVQDGSSIFHIKRFTIGRLFFPSGKIVACDPLLISDFELPFHLEVSPCEADVSLVVSKNGNNNDERVALAILQFDSPVPTRWVMATRDSQALNDLSADDYFGYPVDSGTGSFMDLESANALVHNLKSSKDYYDELVKLLRDNYQHTRAWKLMETNPARRLGIAMFFSGYGDGLYPSYWGFADNGGVVCLVTDFFVFDAPVVVG